MIFAYVSAAETLIAIFYPMPRCQLHLAPIAHLHDVKILAIRVLRICTVLFVTVCNFLSFLIIFSQNGTPSFSNLPSSSFLLYWVVYLCWQVGKYFFIGPPSRIAFSPKWYETLFDNYFFFIAHA